MSKHTPGPWQVIGGNVYGDNLRALLPMNGADARLIAAAPDLLEALEYMVGPRIDLTNAICHRGITTAEKCGQCSKELKARAAIAKAKGE